MRLSFIIIVKDIEIALSSHSVSMLHENAAHFIFTYSLYHIKIVRLFFRLYSCLIKYIRYLDLVEEMQSIEGVAENLYIT
jgi:hypothetical protein